MTALTKQDEARIVELAKASEMCMELAAGNAFERVEAWKESVCEGLSAEAFRIATAARTALSALCESGYAPVSALVADGGAA